MTVFQKRTITEIDSETDKIRLPSKENFVIGSSYVALHDYGNTGLKPYYLYAISQLFITWVLGSINTTTSYF